MAGLLIYESSKFYFKDKLQITNLLLPLRIKYIEENNRQNFDEKE